MITLLEVKTPRSRGWRAIRPPALPISASAASSAGPLISTSNRLPCRTALTRPNPRRLAAPAMASPCGSWISGLSITSTITRATCPPCRSGRGRAARDTVSLRRSPGVTRTAPRPAAYCDHGGGRNLTPRSRRPREPGDDFPGPPGPTLLAWGDDAGPYPASSGGPPLGLRGCAGYGDICHDDFGGPGLGHRNHHTSPRTSQRSADRPTGQSRRSRGQPRQCLRSGT